LLEVEFTEPLLEVILEGNIQSLEMTVPDNTVSSPEIAEAPLLVYFRETITNTLVRLIVREFLGVLKLEERLNFLNRGDKSL
jgi:hypothetical protein